MNAPAYDPRLLLYKPFPTDALPEPLKEIVLVASRSIGCDPSMIAVPMLSVLGSCIGTTRAIQLKAGWCEPPIIWTAVVARSGSLKSPAHEFATSPLFSLQERAYQEFKAEYAEYKRVKESKPKNKQSTEQENNDHAKPVLRRYLVSDTTVEALSVVLEENPRGLLVTRDELGGWLGSFNKYRNGNGGDVQAWLELFNGRASLIDRKTAQQSLVIIPRAAVSITGTIQPEILSRILGDQHFENGLTARFLLASPPFRRKTWREQGITSSITDNYNHLIDGLLGLWHEGKFAMSPEPVKLPLSNSGLEAWCEFFNAMAARQNMAESDREAAGLAKLEAYCARLALIMYCVREVSGDVTLESKGTVDSQSVEMAVELIAWFEREMYRVYRRLDETGDWALQRELVEIIQSRGGAIAPHMLSKQRRKYQPVDMAESALNNLMELGIGKWVYMNGKGRPSKLFRLYDLHAQGDDNMELEDEAENSLELVGKEKLNGSL